MTSRAVVCYRSSTTTTTVVQVDEDPQDDDHDHERSPQDEDEDEEDDVFQDADYFEDAESGGKLVTSVDEMVPAAAATAAILSALGSS